MTYEIRITGGFDTLGERGGTIKGELESPLLDRSMHPRGILKLALKTHGVGVKSGGPGFVVDAFQVDSISEYLGSQGAIRALLETEIRNLSDNAGPAGKRVSQNVWKHATIMGIVLYRRQSISPDDLKKLKKLRPNLTAKQIDSEFDKPDTRATFTVEVRIDWDKEHLYHLVIRDGNLAQSGTA